MRAYESKRRGVMKKLLSVLALLAAVIPIKASIISSIGPLVVVALPHSRSVAVVLTMPADFVSVPLNIISEQKNSAVAYDESRQGIDLIEQKAKQDGRFRTSRGVVSLAEHEKSFGISSGGWTQPAAAAHLYLLVPFTKDRDNIFLAGAEAARFVEGLSLPGKVRCKLGNLQLAVENPEQYRSKLLEQIAREGQRTRELIGNGSLEVKGLESPVIVRQADDRNVELYLGYSLSITREK